jgi:hypothetical protein
VGATAVASEEAEQTTGEIELTGRGTEVDDNPARVAEYRSTQDNAELKLAIEAEVRDFFFNLDGHHRSGDEQQYDMNVDFYRVLRNHTTWTKLPHRLVHDRLLNLGGTISEVKVTDGTDLDPDGRYGIRYAVFRNQTELALPGAKWLVVSADYNQQWRKGNRQSKSVSHCSTCHVQARPRDVDETTRDIGVTARANFHNWTILGRFQNRKFSNDADPTLTQYTLAEHPSLRTPVFNDRISYDAKDGVLEYGSVPAVEKKTGKVEVSNADLGGFNFSAAGVFSGIKNRNTGNTMDYKGGSFNLAKRIGARARVSVRARGYTVDNDDVFVDINEPVAVAGPYAGMTYREKWGFVPDFTRQSAANRNVTEFQGRFHYRLPHRSHFSATYKMRHLDREYYQVAPGETSTTEHKVRLAYSVRPSRRAQFRASAIFAGITDPFMSLNAACQDVMQPFSVPSPLAPTSTQYYLLHDSRLADMTSSPSRYTEIKLGGSFRFGGNAIASASYRWWDGDNDTLDLTDWSRSLHSLTATVNWMPLKRSELHGAVAYAKRDQQTRACIPIMDG